MAMSDEVRQAPRYKPKQKKSFSESFIPRKGDKTNVIVSKLIVLASLLVLIGCGVVLGIYFYHIYEAKQNNINIHTIKSQMDMINTPDSDSPAVTTSVDENGEIVRDPDRKSVV